MRGQFQGFVTGRPHEKLENNTGDNIATGGSAASPLAGVAIGGSHENRDRCFQTSSKASHKEGRVRATGRDKVGGLQHRNLCNHNDIRPHGRC